MTSTYGLVCRRRLVVGRRGVVVGEGRLAVSRLVVRRLADGAGRLVRVRVRVRVRLRLRVRLTLRHRLRLRLRLRLRVRLRA